MLNFSEKKTLFIQLDRIVKQGTINVIGKNNNLIIKHCFENSNFEKLGLTELTGRFDIILDLENEKIKKQINI
jgi:hypothetical protein